MPQGTRLTGWGGVAQIEPGFSRLNFAEGQSESQLCEGDQPSPCSCADWTDVISVSVGADLGVATYDSSVALATTFAGDCDCCTTELEAEATSVEITAVTDTCVAGRIHMTTDIGNFAATDFAFAIPRC